MRMLSRRSSVDWYDTVVIGAGKSGLAAGYYLARTSRSFVMIDANERPGDTWRRRWDSLRLFSPAQWNGLPGLPFPAPAGTFPTKDEMADYLDVYARRFELPIEHGVRVTRVASDRGRFVVECTDRSLVCSNLVVATGYSADARVPDFAKRLGAKIRQLHSSAYRRPSDVPGASVLVVGFGTSGAEIAMELAAAGRNVRIAGYPTFHIPNLVLKLPGNLWWRFIHNVLTIDTPIGRRAAPKFKAGGAPLIRVDRAQVIASGVEHVSRVSGTMMGAPQLDDGRILDVSDIVWCTGFRPDYGFLDLPALRLDAKGWPIAPYGVAERIPGLYFLGVPFQVGLTSLLVGGAERDAGLVVRHIEQRPVLQEPLAVRRGSPTRAVESVESN
jgi:putative flavoprotein involved in K+ transport